MGLETVWAVDSRRLIAGPGERKRRLSRLLLSIVLWACAPSSQGDASAGVFFRSEPLWTVAIPLESDVPLEPDFAAVVGDSLLVVGLVSAPHLWLLPVTGESGTRGRLQVDPPPGEPPVRGILYSDSTGTLFVAYASGHVRSLSLVPDSGRMPYQAEWMIPGMHEKRILGLRSFGDGFLVLTERLTGERGSASRSSSLLLEEPSPRGDSTVVVLERERWTASNMAAGLADRIHLWANGVKAGISGSFPPRLELWLHDQWIGDSLLFMLTDGPSRQALPREIAAARAARRGIPTRLLKDLPPIEQLPPVIKASPLGGGALVAAGGPGRTFLLDQYCSDGYRRTLETRDAVRRVFVANGWVILGLRSSSDPPRYSFAGWPSEVMEPDCS